MGQLSRRISRLIRAELNSINLQDHTNKYGEGAAFVAGGAAAGASVGKIGILAGGTGFSVGNLPLAGAGVLTGAALYEAIKILVDGDSSSLSAVATGAAAGAGISAATGGVGVAVGGTAFGVGMASMTGIGAVAGLGIAGLYRLLQQNINLEDLLNLAIEDMQEDLIKLRQFIIPVIANQKRIQQKYIQAQAEVNKWQKYAQLALQKSNENLAREALVRKKSQSDTAAALKATLDTQTTQVETLKRNLIALESKISEAKTKKDMLKARAQAMKANEKLQEIVGRMGTGSAMAAFERMEEKVLMMEARTHSAQELAGVNLEQQFAALEAGSDVDDELAALKAKLTGNSSNHQLPSVNPTTVGSYLSSGIDKDLEELRKQIDLL